MLSKFCLFYWPVGVTNILLLPFKLNSVPSTYIGDLGKTTKIDKNWNIQKETFETFKHLKKKHLKHLKRNI